MALLQRLRHGIQLLTKSHVACIRTLVDHFDGLARVTRDLQHRAAHLRCRRSLCRLEDCQVIAHLGEKIRIEVDTLVEAGAMALSALNTPIESEERRAQVLSGHKADALDRHLDRSRVDRALGLWGRDFWTRFENNSLEPGGNKKNTSHMHNE